MCIISLDTRHYVSTTHDLSSLHFQDFLNRNNGDRQQAMRSLSSHIEKWFPLCPKSWQREEHKVDFLRKALLPEAWSHSILSEITSETKFRELYLKIMRFIQTNDEAQKHLTGTPHAQPSNTSNTMKPNIFFQKYGKRMARKMFPGNNMDNGCWNCGGHNHRFSKCRKPMNPVAIAARKARFLEKKYKGKQSGKRVLHEMVVGLGDLYDVDCDQNADEINTYFGSGDKESDTDSGTESSSSEEVPPVTISFNTTEDSDCSNLDF